MEQAALLRSGHFSALDIEHIAEGIEDVGKSELASCMAVLLAHWLQWQHQPGRRDSNWRCTLKEQRKAIAAAMRQTPSLKVSLSDAGVWADAVTKAVKETGLDNLPEDCPWAMGQVLSAEFFPEAWGGLLAQPGSGGWAVLPYNMKSVFASVVTPVKAIANSAASSSSVLPYNTPASSLS